MRHNNSGKRKLEENADSDTSKPQFPQDRSYVNKGSVLMEAEPFACVLEPKFSHERCDNCLKKRKIKQCSACNSVCYCSIRCQREAWFFHRIECSNIRAFLPDKFPQLVRLLGHIVIKLASWRRAEKGYFRPNMFRNFDNLTSHADEIRKDPMRMEHFQAVYFLLAFLLPQAIWPNEPEALELYGRMMINSLSIFDDSTEVAKGVYLGPSIINHDCKPNAFPRFDGRKLSIVALEDIPIFHWSKISISYVNGMLPTLKRRKRLHDLYYFLCKCERCKIELRAALGPRKKCNCRKCRKNLPSAFWGDVREVESESLASQSVARPKKIQNPRDADAEKSNKCRICLKKDAGCVHPINILQVRISKLSSRESSNRNSGKRRKST